MSKKRWERIEVFQQNDVQAFAESCPASRNSQPGVAIKTRNFYYFSFTATEGKEEQRRPKQDFQIFRGFGE
ncbi:MAG: hypothetical protein FWC50_15900 [Planctomycetaceae bacterium]|nr:hypothetical protein [Planctomycetaceae bacterium]